MFSSIYPLFVLKTEKPTSRWPFPILIRVRTDPVPSGQANGLASMRFNKR